MGTAAFYRGHGVIPPSPHAVVRLQGQTDLRCTTCFVFLLALCGLTHFMFIFHLFISSFNFSLLAIFTCHFDSNPPLDGCTSNFVARQPLGNFCALQPSVALLEKFLKQQMVPKCPIILFPSSFPSTPYHFVFRVKSRCHL